MLINFSSTYPTSLTSFSLTSSFSTSISINFNQVWHPPASRIIFIPCARADLLLFFINILQPQRVSEIRKAHCAAFSTFKKLLIFFPLRLIYTAVLVEVQKTAQKRCKNACVCNWAYSRSIATARPKTKSVPSKEIYI